MALISADILNALKGDEQQTKEDRQRLDIVLAFCAAVIIGLLVWKPPVDTKVVELAMSNAWIGGMVALIVYVFGVRVKKSRPAPQPPNTTINVNPAPDAPAPAPIVEAVQKVKADTTAIRKKVKA